MPAPSLSQSLNLHTDLSHDVPGDGTMTITLSESEPPPMNQPIDLPSNVAAQLQLESVGNIQANNRDGRNAATAAMSVMQLGAAKAMTELDSIESRANSGILGTPLASPTIQTGTP